MGVKSPQVSVFWGTVKHILQGSRWISLLHTSGRSNAPSDVQQAISRSGMSIQKLPSIVMPIMSWSILFTSRSSPLSSKYVAPAFVSPKGITLRQNAPCSVFSMWAGPVPPIDQNLIIFNSLMSAGRAYPIYFNDQN